MRKTERVIRKMVLILAGGAMLFNLSGCGKVKYNVSADNGYELKKTEYAYGDKVKATYGPVGTDTDYTFYADSPDVSVDASYKEGKGYEVSFTMPEHDVKLLASRTNSMATDTVDGEKPDIKALYENAELIFNYYEKTEATERGSSGIEYAIYDCGDRNKYILARYKTEDGEETCELCWTTEEPYSKCLELVEKYDMRHWKEEDSLEGALYVVRIAYGQDVLRISSESMAKDGMEAFSAISEYISGAWNKYQGMMDGS